jgi:hypothetical protein
MRPKATAAEVINSLSSPSALRSAIDDLEYRCSTFFLEHVQEEVFPIAPSQEVELLTVIAATEDPSHFRGPEELHRIFLSLSPHFFEETDEAQQRRRRRRASPDGREGKPTLTDVTPTEERVVCVARADSGALRGVFRRLEEALSSQINSKHR